MTWQSPDRFVAIRAFNEHKNRILLHKHRGSGTWTLPSILEKITVEPLKCLERLLGKTVRSKDWGLVSFTPILDTTNNKDFVGLPYIVYDIDYVGKFLDEERKEDLLTVSEVRWFNPQCNIDNIRPCTPLTFAIIKAMLKDNV